MEILIPSNILCFYGLTWDALLKIDWRKVKGRSRETMWRLLQQSTEKAVAPHSSTLAWKIPWILKSMDLPEIHGFHGGAWWAAVYGSAQSWTRLKWLSSSSSSNPSDLWWENGGNVSGWIMDLYTYANACVYTHVYFLFKFKFLSSFKPTEKL